MQMPTTHAKTHFTLYPVATILSLHYAVTIKKCVKAPFDVIFL